ncbi:MAG: transglutaminase domain-containing protein [Desulfobulbaceae bacterium]|nr:transglutaminase domain-containing protein [Desulfobulbaceae bacterium]
MKKILFVIWLAILMANPAFALSGSHSGTMKMEFDLSNHANGKEARLWIPYPVSDKYQDISNVHLSGDYVEAAIYTDKVFKTPMIYARWKKSAKSRKLNFSCDITRQERLDKDLPPWETQWDPADYAPYLTATTLAPIDGPVKALADEITAGKGTVQAKARAIYDWICENMFRDPETNGCGSGDVCSLLLTRGGKCADIHSVFVALARAAGVPSREVFGIRQGKKGDTDVTTWEHCWAEFYLPGYGWVVVDPGDVRKMMLKEKLSLEDAKTTEYRQYFWGGADPYRVKLGIGRDLNLTPPQHGGTVNYLMYPFAQIGEETLDWLDPKTFTYKITHTSR